MSANFCDRRWSAWMIGVDHHVYLVIPPSPDPITKVTGVPKLDHEHLVAAPHTWCCNGKHTSTVTSEGHEIIQKGFDLEYVPHIPLPMPPPAPLEAAMLGGITVISSSKPRLHVSSVHGQGKALASCFWCFVNINKNCGDFLNIDFNTNTVRTQPSTGDYVGAVVELLIDTAIGKLIGKYVPHWVLQWLVDKLIKDPFINPVIEKVRDEVQELVDELV